MRLDRHRWKLQPYWCAEEYSYEAVSLVLFVLFVFISTFIEPCEKQDGTSHWVYPETINLNMKKFNLKYRTCNGSSVFFQTDVNLLCVDTLSSLKSISAKLVACTIIILA